MLWQGKYKYSTSVIYKSTTKKTPQYLCGWVKSWTSTFSYESHFYVTGSGYLDYSDLDIWHTCPSMPGVSLSETTDLEILFFFFSTENNIFCKSLNTGKAPQITGICLRHRLRPRLPYCQPHYPSLFTTRDRRLSVSPTPSLETELTLPKKEMPGGKTDTSDTIQPLNFYFVIFTIRAIKQNTERRH